MPGRIVGRRTRSVTVLDAGSPEWGTRQQSEASTQQRGSMYKMRIIHIVTVIISSSVTISSEIEGGGEIERETDKHTDRHMRT